MWFRVSTKPPRNPLSDAKATVLGDSKGPDPRGESDPEPYTPEDPELRTATAEIAENHGVPPGGTLHARTVVRADRDTPSLPHGTHAVKVPNSVGSDGDAADYDSNTVEARSPSPADPDRKKSVGSDGKTAESDRSLSFRELATRIRQEPIGPDPKHPRPGVGPDSRPVGAHIESVGSEGETVGTDSLARFRGWCKERAQNDKRHRFTRKEANRKFARDKDVGRWFVEECERFTTVLITYDVESEPEESIADHASRIYSRTVRDTRRKILKNLGVYDSFAGVSVLAPDTTDRGRYSATHGHDFIRVPGWVNERAFEPLLSLDMDIDVRVEHHESGDVSTPLDVLERGSGLDAERGDTTSLAQELGGNLPLLRTRFDARGLSEAYERWCAAMRVGSDGTLDTRGIKTRRPVQNGSGGARYTQIADQMKVRRHRRRVIASIQYAVILAMKIAGRAGRQGVVLKHEVGETPSGPSLSGPTPGVCAPRPPKDVLPPPQRGGSKAT